MTDPTGVDAMLVSSAIGRAVAMASALVAGASVIAALTPTPRDDALLGRLYRVLDILAFNFGRAKDTPPNRDGGRFTAS
jgi:hypothetical protein